MLCMSYLTSFAQKDSTIFKGYLSNNEYEVYLQINFYQNDIKYQDKKSSVLLQAFWVTERTAENG